MAGIYGFVAPAILGYVVVAALATLMQRDMIYFPVHITQHEYARQAAALPGFVQVLAPYAAIILEPPSPSPPPRGTVLVLHGNAGTALDRFLYAREAFARGFRLVLAEYPGYGPREGPISEDALVQDAKALFAELRRKYPGEEIVLMGESLGSGVAVRVAAESPMPPDRLVLLVPFASLVDVASQRMPYLPVRWLLWDTYRSAEHIQSYAGPVALLVAEHDEVVGSDTGKELLRAAERREKKVRQGPGLNGAGIDVATTQIVLVQAGHNDVVDRLAPESWSLLLGRPTINKPSPSLLKDIKAIVYE